MKKLLFLGPEGSYTQIAYNYICDIYKKAQAEENKKKKAITSDKIFGTINSINNAGYEVRSIKNNALNVIKGF